MKQHLAGVRALLALVTSTVALASGVSTAFLQSGNFALAAELDGLQQEHEWNERCTTYVRGQIEEFAFASAARDDRERAQGDGGNTAR